MEKLLHIISFDEAMKDYTDSGDLEASLQDLGCSGLEIIRCGPVHEKIKPQMVKGLHLCFYPCWLDFWNGDEKALAAEFGSRETWESFYQGKDPSCLLVQFQEDLQCAKELGAAYVVFHVSDVTIEGVCTHSHGHTSFEVVDAAAEVINLLLDGKDYDFYFLMENLWWPGLTLTQPEVTKRLLSKVHYEKKGIMMDLGHLMCANINLQDREDAYRYVCEKLNAHGDLVRYIKGIHMHESVTGAYVREMLANPPKLKSEYYERFAQAYEFLEHIDTHEPITCDGFREVIERLNPLFLVHELRAAGRKEREEKVRIQNRTLSRIGL